MSARRGDGGQGPEVERNDPEGPTGAASAEAFDARLARLEALVTELEGGGLGLEASIERYREGVALLRGCRETLGRFQRQVEELTQGPGGDVAARPYPGDPDLGGGPSAR